MKSERDSTLDYLKGFACVLMIFAHAPGITDSIIVKLLRVTGELAPIIFFGVTGITSRIQADKYTTFSIFFSNILLFLFGYSLNSEYFLTGKLGLLQIIALGSLVVALLSQLLKKEQHFFLVWLSLTVTYVILNFKSENLLYLCDSIIPTGKAGTFPLFPWLSFFIFGSFSYRILNRYNLYFFFIFIFIYFLVLDQNFKIQKWEFSITFYFLSYAFLAFTIYTFRKFNFFNLSRVSSMLTFFGKNSLVFIYLQLLFVEPTSFIMGGIIPLTWIVLTSLVILFIYILQLSFSLKIMYNIFSNIYSWLILLILIIFVPFVCKDYYYSHLTELSLGAIFASNYSTLFKMIKRPRNFESTSI